MTIPPKAARARRLAGRTKIPGADLRGIPTPIPPLAKQMRIVAEVERRLSVVEELESVVTANLQRATRLRQSILQKPSLENCQHESSTFKHFPIVLPDAEVSVGVQPFHSKDAMRELRKAHAGARFQSCRCGGEREEAGSDLRGAARWHGLHYLPGGKEDSLAGEPRRGTSTGERKLHASFAGRTDRKIVDVGPLKVLSSERSMTSSHRP